MFKDVTIHTKSLSELKWSTDGQYLGTASYDHTIKIGQLDLSGNIRTLQSGSSKRSIPQYLRNRTVPSPFMCSQIGWHPIEASRFLVAGEEKSVDVWDVRGTASA